MYCTYSNVSTKFQFQYTNYIYSNKNPNLISFSTLILGTKVPDHFLVALKLGKFLCLREPEIHCRVHTRQSVNPVMAEITEF
jgi:hypothetical protein